jgi:hypothetical protein
MPLPKVMAVPIVCSLHCLCVLKPFRHVFMSSLCVVQVVAERNAHGTPFGELTGLTYLCHTTHTQPTLIAAEITGHCFHSIEIDTGKVQRFAGCGVSGFSSHAMALASRFAQALAVCVDASDGSVLCSDRCSVRRIKNGACVCVCFTYQFAH